MRLPVSNADLNFECVSQQQILTKLTKCSAQIFRLSGASKVPARGYRKKLDHRVKKEALKDLVQTALFDNLTGLYSRNIRGGLHDFYETWPDEGDVNMYHSMIKFFGLDI